jgi:hypothetical protein
MIFQPHRRRRAACIVFSLLFVLLGFQAGAQSVRMTVQVAKSQIRAAPSAVAPIIATVEYRTILFAAPRTDGWAQVIVPGGTRVGYMFLSALSPKSIPLGAVQEALSGVSAPEIALAGKGFDTIIESQLKKTVNLDYSLVDVMESFHFTAEVCERFISGGSGK